MAAEDYRDQLLRQWEGAGEAWGRHREWFQTGAGAVSRWMVEAVDPQPGERLLELAAGPGDTGFMAAQAVGAQGSLLTTDLTESMLDAGRARAGELGLENVEFRVMDAESLDLEAASFDAALCRWGYMLMADPPAALKETRRVLRPGGRLALAAWAGPEANRWASVIAGTAREVLGTPAPDPDLPGIFHFAPPGRIESRLQDAGFSEIRVEAVDFEQVFSSWEHWWDTVLELGRMMAVMLEEATPEQQQRIREGVREASAQFAESDGLRIPARTWVASAAA